MSRQGEDVLPALPGRTADANKGACGKVLVIGGSRGMAGAPCLAARAALRGGAGLVKVAVPESLWDVVAIKLDECLTLGLPQTRDGAFSRRALDPLLAACAWADVVALGPGLGPSVQTRGLIRSILKSCSVPIVLDADGLNAFAQGRLGELARAQARHPGRALILTPHPGEMARLLDLPIPSVQKDRRSAAAGCARKAAAIAVLKGHQTVLSDGSQCRVNRTGNPGMASGGTGDVLTGLIAALLGQGLRAWEAACLGVHLHGLAGDLAAQDLGPWSLLAGDLVEALPRAFLQHQAGGRRSTKR